MCLSKEKLDRTLVVGRGEHSVNTRFGAGDLSGTELQGTIMCLFGICLCLRKGGLKPLQLQYLGRFWYQKGGSGHEPKTSGGVREIGLQLQAA